MPSMAMLTTDLIMLHCKSLISLWMLTQPLEPLCCHLRLMLMASAIGVKRQVLVRSVNPSQATSLTSGWLRSLQCPYADIDALMSCGCKLMACLGGAFVHDGSSTSGPLLPLPLCRL